MSLTTRVSTAGDAASATTARSTPCTQVRLRSAAQAALPGAVDQMQETLNSLDVSDEVKAYIRDLLADEYDTTVH